MKFWQTTLGQLRFSGSDDSGGLGGRRVNRIGDCRFVENFSGGRGDTREDASHFAGPFAQAVIASAVGPLAEARQRRDRTIDDPKDLAESNIIGWPQKKVTARLAAPARYDAMMLEVKQDLFKELFGNALILRDFGNEEGRSTLFFCKHDERPQGVFCFL
jgi:hypothetical protein